MLLDPPSRAAGAGAARAAALHWVGAGIAEQPRRDDEEWEVDVRREDGSLVEVTIGPGLDLRGFDEERGPGDTPAPNDLTGADRSRAVAAALEAAGPGTVRSAERERDGTLEVDLRRPDGRILEVELDAELQVRDLDEETPGDE